MKLAPVPLGVVFTALLPQLLRRISSYADSIAKLTYFVGGGREKKRPFRSGFLRSVGFNSQNCPAKLQSWRNADLDGEEGYHKVKGLVVVVVKQVVM